MANVNLPGFVCHLVCLLLGALLTLSFAPFELWWLGLFSWRVSAAYFGPIVDRQLDSILLLLPSVFFRQASAGSLSASTSLEALRTSSCADCHALCPSLVADVFASSMVIASPGERQLESSRLLVCCDLGIGRGAASDGADRFPWLLVGTAHVNTIFAGWAPLGSVFGQWRHCPFCRTLDPWAGSAPPGLNIVPLHGINGFTDGDGMGVLYPVG